MMYATIGQLLSPVEIEAVWDWSQAMPASLKPRWGMQKITPDAFLEACQGDLHVKVYDGDLLGFVTLEPKGDGIFEAHLFCPRRTPSEKLAEAIATFFAAVKENETMNKLLFRIRQKQSRLRNCLIDEGCVYEGWTFRECGDTFDCYIFLNCVKLAKV